MTERMEQPGADGAHDEAEDDEVEIVTLVDESGNEQSYMLMDVIDVDDQEYALLVPADDEAGDDEETEAVVLRLEGDELVPIEDEAEMQRVAARLEALANEEEE